MRNWGGHLKRTTWAALAGFGLISAACGAAGKGGRSGGGGGGSLSPSTTSVSQQEMAAQFPKGDVAFKGCVYTEGGEKLTNRTDTRTLTFADDAISWGSPPGYKRMEEPGGDFFRGAPSQFASNTLMYILLDKRVYFASVTGPLTSEKFDIQWICALDGNTAAILSRDGAWHKDQIRAYNARRAATAKIPLGGGDGFSAQMPPEQKALITKFRGMKSFTTWARASDENTEPYVAVTALFPDGSKQSMDVNNAVFDDIFQVSVVRTKTRAVVTVTALHDETIQAQGTLRFDHNTDRTFECRGNDGRTGLDIGPDGGMLYHGQPGDPGPSIKVEIGTNGDRNDENQQILGYRISCGSRVETFKANSESPVYVHSIGGKGGHGIPWPKGDGTNGGNGGDGGDIEIVVTSTVEKYNVTAVSTPGSGGSASDRSKTNRFTYGKDGNPGNAGSTTKRVVKASL